MNTHTYKVNIHKQKNNPTYNFFSSSMSMDLQVPVGGWDTIN